MGCSGSTEAAGQSAAAPAQPSASATPSPPSIGAPKKKHYSGTTFKELLQTAKDSRSLPVTRRGGNTRLFGTGRIND